MVEKIKALGEIPRAFIVGLLTGGQPMRERFRRLTDALKPFIL